MAATAQVKLKPLARPYTRGTFRHRLKQFEELIKEITLQDVDGTPEERRKLIAENLHFDEFCASIRALFDKDIKSQDIKNIFQKISTNPDGKFDWSELFGYSPSLATQEEQGNSWNENSSNVFAVSSRKRIGEACGDRKRCDVAVGIRYIAPLDCYATVSQRGCLCIWTNKFRLQSCSDICDKSWVTGCDYLPNIRKLAVSTERNVCLLDTRSNGSQQTSYMIQLMDNSIQCLAYVPMNHDTMGSHRDTMLFGDEVGYVGLLTVDAVDISSNRPTENERTKSSTVKLDPMKLTW